VRTARFMNNLHQYAHSQKFGKPYISKVILGASKTNGIISIAKISS